jgi:serine/threonine-protein kinase
VIAEKYRVERVLGAGGMGVVVAARHLRLDQEVAIKFLSPDMLSEPTAVSRFEREARAAAKLQNEHVVRVFDVGTLPDGAPYMVMERLHGSDLSSRLQQAGNLAVEETADFVIQACIALREAHSLGIIHRDIKPSNLFCVGGPGQRVSVKVLDFGISKLTLASTPFDGSITATATAIGSPNYMSPEQMRSANRVDARADIWSLGIVLYELLTGKLPFRAETYPDLCLKIAGEPPAPPRSLRADLPEALQGIILRCLEKDPDLRFGSADELAEALLPFAPAHVRATFAPRAVLQVASQTASSSASAPGEPAKARFAWGRSSTRGRPTQLDTAAHTSARRRLPAAALGLVLATGGLLATGIWWQHRDQTPARGEVTSAPLPEPTPHAAVPAPLPAEPLASAPSPTPSPVVVPIEPSANPVASSAAPRPATAALASARASTSAAATRSAAAAPATASSRTVKADRRGKTAIWTKRD